MARGSSGRGVLGRLQSLGFRHGFAGGGRLWWYLGTGMWALRMIRRLSRPRVEILLSEELKPGDRLIIANDRPTLDPPTPVG